MCKLLIIDDQLNIVEKIQNQLESINRNFKKDNVFCFYGDSNIDICSLNSLTDFCEKVQFENKKQTVFEKIYNFLNTYCKEDVLIIVDTLLLHEPGTSLSAQSYIDSTDYGCEIYAELTRIANGKTIKNYDNINSNNIGFFICSRSHSASSFIPRILRNIYLKQDKEDAKFFDLRDTKFTAIDWIYNDANEDNPLILSDDRATFIKEEFIK